MTDWQQRIAALIGRLTHDVPVDPADQTKEQRARWILAHSLDFHRRENKAVWWEYYRLRDLSADDLMHGENLRGGVAFAIGLPIGIAGVTFHWWKTRVRPGVSQWALNTADKLWPIALIFTFIFLSGLLTQKSVTQQTTAPTASEIAAAVVRALPKQNAPAPTPAVPATSFVNPFHDNMVKWQIVEGVRVAILRSGLSQDCHATIVRLQEPYPEDFSAEFKRILDVIGWKYNEQFATTSVPKDVTVLSIDYNQTPELRSQSAPGLAWSGGCLEVEK